MNVKTKFDMTESAMCAIRFAENVYQKFASSPSTSLPAPRIVLKVSDMPGVKDVEVKFEGEIGRRGKVGVRVIDFTLSFKIQDKGRYWWPCEGMVGLVAMDVRTRKAAVVNTVCGAAGQLSELNGDVDGFREVACYG